MNNYFSFALIILLFNNTIFSMDNESSPKTVQLFNKDHSNFSDNPGCPIPDNVSQGCVRCLQMVNHTKGFSPQESMFSSALKNCLGCLKSAQNIRFEIPDEIPACGLGATTVIAGIIAVNEIASALSTRKKIKKD